MRYIKPATIEEACSAAGVGKAYFLAGGTDIMVLRKENMLESGPLVDISGLERLRGVRFCGNEIHIGALTTMSGISTNPHIAEQAAALSSSAALMGSPLIRNLATIGGNIANSNPAGDTIPPLLALGGVIVAFSGSGSRRIPSDDFFTGPGKNILNPGEIIEKIIIPVSGNSFSVFKKLGPRRALAISKVSLALWCRREGGKLSAVRIALGAVGPRCLRAENTERMLTGTALTPGLIDKASESVRGEASPIDDFRSSANYRRRMTGVLLKRALEEVMRKGGT